MDHEPTVWPIEWGELLEFCNTSGYRCRLEPAGSLLIPPDYNVSCSLGMVASLNCSALLLSVGLLPAGRPVLLLAGVACVLGLHRRCTGLHPTATSAHPLLTVLAIAHSTRLPQVGTTDWEKSLKLRRGEFSVLGAEPARPQPPKGLFADGAAWAMLQGEPSAAGCGLAAAAGGWGGRAGAQLAAVRSMAAVMHRPIACARCTRAVIGRNPSHCKLISQCCPLPCCLTCRRRRNAGGAAAECGD